MKNTCKYMSKEHANLSLVVPTLKDSIHVTSNLVSSFIRILNEFIFIEYNTELTILCGF